MVSAKKPNFSICIPNFNYLKYLPLTCQSVTSQNYSDYEIVISDNQSTDGSIDFVNTFKSERKNVKININPVNLGFATNLERATALASGDYFILLSSDDLMNAGSLRTYAALIGECNNSRKFVLGSSVFKIDSEGGVIDRSYPDPNFWRQTDVDQSLSQLFGHRVFKVDAAEMLSRCLNVMGNPYYFLTVCYPRELFEKVGGYAGGRMYNPDKWFNWKLFSDADYVILIDEPLFSYRWHAQNQVAMETSFGHLRYLVDEYRNTIEMPEIMLKKSGLTRKASELNFINRNIYRHGMGEFAKGRWLKSLRVFCFGLATFPLLMIKRPLFGPYVGVLLTTPIGAKLAGLIYRLLKR